MPVLDHEVHDKVRISADKPYGCHSRTKFGKFYYAFDRVYSGHEFVIIKKPIPHEMSTACRSFYLWDTDPRCIGCTSERDEEYANKMKGL